jgi:hypothetical protein
VAAVLRKVKVFVKGCTWFFSASSLIGEGARVELSCRLFWQARLFRFGIISFKLHSHKKNKAVCVMEKKLNL